MQWQRLDAIFAKVLAAKKFHRRFLYAFMWDNRRLLSVYTITALACGLLKIAVLMLLGKGFEMLSKEHTVKSALLDAAFGVLLPAEHYFPLFWLAVTVLFAGVLMLEKYQAAILGERFVAGIRSWLFEHQMAWPSAQIEKNGYGAQLIRYGSDLSALKQYIVRGYCRFFSDLLLVFGMLTLLWYLDRLSCGLVLACIASGMLIIWLAQRWVYPRLSSKRREQSRLIGFVGRRFESLERLQDPGRFAQAIDRFGQKNRALYRSTIHYYKFRSILDALAETMPYFTLAVLWMSISIRQYPPPLSVPILLLTIFPAFRRLSAAPSVWQRGKLSFQKLEALERVGS